MTSAEVQLDDADEFLRLDRQLCFPLYAATNLLQRIYRPILAPLGLTYSQYLVMLLLWEQESVTVGVLRDCLHLDTGTLSPLLKRMERAGFITRQRDAADERRVLIMLTPRGNELRHGARAVPEKLSRQLRLEPDAINNLRDAAKGLVRDLAGQ